MTETQFKAFLKVLEGIKDKLEEMVEAITAIEDLMRMRND